MYDVSSSIELRALKIVRQGIGFNPEFLYPQESYIFTDSALCLSLPNGI